MGHYQQLTIKLRSRTFTRLLDAIEIIEILDFMAPLILGEEMFGLYISTLHETQIGELSLILLQVGASMISDKNEHINNF